MKYHKIQSVYHRDPANKFKTFLEGEWSEPEFGFLAPCKWSWQEKIDGTNIRVYWDGKAKTVRFMGRRDLPVLEDGTPTNVPTFLLEQLKKMFPVENLDRLFQGRQVVLYGEGYGAGVQKGGGNYMPDGCSFRLFDVFIGTHWIEQENVQDIAGSLVLPYAPMIGEGTLTEAIELVRKGFVSQCAQTPQFIAEGLICRPAMNLLTRSGDRIITKVKCKDFK
jgi:hypothetical protein